MTLHWLVVTVHVATWWKKVCIQVFKNMIISHLFLPFFDTRWIKNYKNKRTNWFMIDTKRYI